MLCSSWRRKTSKDQLTAKSVSHYICSNRQSKDIKLVHSNIKNKIGEQEENKIPEVEVEVDRIERGFLRLRLFFENRNEIELGGEEVTGRFVGRRRREGLCVVIAENAIAENLLWFPFFFVEMIKWEILYLCDSGQGHLGGDICIRKILAVQISDGLRWVLHACCCREIGRSR